ncbi:hypothetical protein [Brevibacillus daliensis]|uniref:hypothetical protein n=1 Tax=Brevibacillus daliensis TaxID=2892995 RepID=UPI001E3061E8|nr:hypothetical protein [Brevibacillus daliensis]
MNKSVIWISASILTLAVVMIAFIYSFNVQKEEATDSKEPKPEVTTIQVEERFGVEKDWQQNGKENQYLTKLLEGELASESIGVIQSDTDCEADEMGISQCHNEIELENKQTITIINIHNMMNYVCFYPGEKVKIIPSEDGQWMQVSKITL